MNDPQVAEYTARLKDMSGSVRRFAAYDLGEIGDACAVPSLIEALKDENEHVRQNAVDALGKIGHVSAVPALIAALKDTSEYVRRWTASALGKIGDASAVPSLIEALNDDVYYVSIFVPAALGQIGDLDTLPRKILAASRLSAQERINVLEKLRRVRYNQGSVILHYKFPATRALCQAVLQEEDVEARKGAQAVLDWLDGDRHLLRGSQPDTSKQSEELLRAAQGGEPETRPDTLLRASDEPEKDVSPPLARPTGWKRLFGKRNGASSP